MTEDDPIITVNDCRSLGHCPAGIRRLCEASGHDFRSFVKNGLPESALLETGNAYALAVVEAVRERRKKEGGSHG